jgi:hypothetical protein
MKTFTIKQGNHYCEPTIFGLPLHFKISKTDLTFKFLFHNDCIYDDSKVIPGWNKVFGWSTTGIHTNSVRLVWECRCGKLWTGYYYYLNGIRYSGDLLQAEPEIWYEGECSINLIRVNDTSKEIIGMQKPCIAFQCYPYFGGQSVALQNTHIDII